MFAQSTQLTLCATARLAHGLRQQSQRQSTQSCKSWQTPNIITLSQWLNAFLQQAVMVGEIAVTRIPKHVLTDISEKILWQQAIQSCLQKHELADLFDVVSLAESAIEAHQLMIDWQVPDTTLIDYFQPIETRQFLRWRSAFYDLCTQKNTLDTARLLTLQIQSVLQTVLPLPSHISMLGFDRITPIVQHLIEGLRAKGVVVTHTVTTQTVLAPEKIAFDTIDTECRAAVAWAQQQLAINAQANLAIISPVLGNVRRKLADLLDDTFHPETLQPSRYESPRIYEFSIGLALNEQTIINTALQLLRMATTKQASAQADLSSLLLANNWSNSQECDTRSLLDAHMRKTLKRHLRLQDLSLFAGQFFGGALPSLQLHLQRLQQAQIDFRGFQPPSVWMAKFSQLLADLNWANTRNTSSVEYQILQAWQEALQACSALDVLTNQMSAADALSKLSQWCAASMFLPETTNQPNIQLLGMLESSAVPLDGAWVLGMNDHQWPPPARPNPLLPIALQRDLGMPNASSDIQAAFAQKVQYRLTQTVPQLVFSWALKESDRELRPSPVLENILQQTNNVAPIATLAEKLAHPQQLEQLNDTLAPAVSASEKLRGGSQLFAAQAICPAWAFYQYRLGATKLESPTDGLDRLERGNCVHTALQFFWEECKELSQLKSFSEAILQAQIEKAVDAALRQNLHALIPPRIIDIERARLHQLLHDWLALEKERADFSVYACELALPLTVAGLQLKLRVDRIDMLIGGGLTIIDYKTGSPPSLSDWANERMTNPQLPLYVALVLNSDETLKNQPVTAACFGEVNALECAFTGISDTKIAKGVTAFEKLRSDSAFIQFADMAALTAHWRASLTAIAVEIQTGVAPVKFTLEKDLTYCAVLPLLRLPERAWQFEQLQRLEQP